MANVDDDEFIELFNDAGSEGDFEGFTLQDLEEDDARQPFQELHESNWVEGDRERPAFDFRSTGGLSDHASAELPPDAESKPRLPTPTTAVALDSTGDLGRPGGILSPSALRLHSDL